MNTLILPEQALPRRARSLSASPRIRQALQRRGIELEVMAGEGSEGHQARLETALMALFRDTRGSEEFEALYELAAPEILRRLGRGLHGLGSRFDPLELCQDTFVNIYRYATGFRDEHPRSFRVWAGAISRNVIRRHLANRCRPSAQDLPEGVSEPADQRAGPQVCASLQEERESLGRAWGLLLLHYAAAWEELSPRDRWALELIEVEGHSYAQACERLGVGMSNMKMIMFRARKRIRARIAAAMSEPCEEIEHRRVG